MLCYNQIATKLETGYKKGSKNFALEGLVCKKLILLTPYQYKLKSQWNNWYTYLVVQFIYECKLLQEVANMLLVTNTYKSEFIDNLLFGSYLDMMAKMRDSIFGLLECEKRVQTTMKKGDIYLINQDAHKNNVIQKPVINIPKQFLRCQTHEDLGLFLNLFLWRIYTLLETSISCKIHDGTLDEILNSVYLITNYDLQLVVIVQMCISTPHLLPLNMLLNQFELGLLVKTINVFTIGIHKYQFRAIVVIARWWFQNWYVVVEHRHYRWLWFLSMQVQCESWRAYWRWRQWRRIWLRGVWCGGSWALCGSDKDRLLCIELDHKHPMDYSGHTSALYFSLQLQFRAA